ncbi:MAG: SEC-C domain-containing protein [Desulfobacterales bacterium]|nr:SEC-C domain-containing protein [Desulfobacterales bacterium]
MMKTGRNQKCPCGSGKKYKKCCLPKEEAGVSNGDNTGSGRQKLRNAENEVVSMLLDYAEERLGEQGLIEAVSEFFLWQEEEPDEEYYSAMMEAFSQWFVFDWDAIELVEDVDDTAEHEEEIGQELELPEKSIAILFLEEHAQRLDDFQKKFILEACGQPYSYFQVVDVEPGESLTLKDLILNRKIKVEEQQASGQDLKGAILYTKVITLEGTSIMLGPFPMVVPAEYQGNLIDFRQELIKETGEITPADIREFDYELRKVLVDIYFHVRRGPMPEMQNTDGEPMVPTKLVYELECTPKEAFRALKTLAKGEKEADLLSDADYDKDGGLERVSFPWLKKGNKKHPGWDKTVMGDIEIDKDRMSVEVNSEKRARTIAGEIKKRLKNKAVYKYKEFTSMEEMSEYMQGEQFGEVSGMSQDNFLQMPEVMQKIEEMAKDHWESWLDTSLPALDGMTPRQAVKDPVGKEKLEGLLLDFEASEQRNQDENELTRKFSPDVKKLRQMLGM